MPELKECSKCGELLPVEKFCRRKFDSGNWGYTSWCKPCRNEKSKKDWAEGNIRNSVYKRKFGITLEDYDRMLESQGGRCAICGTDTPTGHGAKHGRFSVDHDHETGEVRGLLCHDCNIGLGGFRDNIYFIEKAIYYLDQHNEGVEERETLIKATQKLEHRLNQLEAKTKTLEAK